jgi:hypothetical protein
MPAATARAYLQAAIKPGRQIFGSLLDGTI